MSHDPKVASELSRELSLFHITMMGLGMMIGAGVFVGMGTSIGYAGPGGAVLTFALGGIVAIFTAMSYAELSSAIPKAGGAYNFARVGFGRGTSFIAGWIEWFASSVAGSLYAVCFSEYTMRFLSGLGVVDMAPQAQAIATKVMAVAIASLFIYINYRGASETGRIGALMTVGQTLFLACIGVIGIVVVIKHPERLQNFKPFLNTGNGGWAAILVTMGITSVAFEGYEVIAQAGDEVVSPRQNIPKAMLYSVLIVTLTYVSVAIATVVAVTPGPDITIGGAQVQAWQWIGHHGADGFGMAIESMLPGVGRLLVTLAVVFASTSALNATVFSATRASYALGRDRMLPSVFAKIGRTRRTPWVALLFTGGIVVIIATCMNVRQVAASASIMFLFLFLLVNVCVIKIRRNMGDELRYGFLMPLFPFFPIAAIVAQALLAFFLHRIGLIAWIVAPAWISLGIAVYWLYSRSHAVATEDEIHVFEEEEPETGQRPRVMVAVADLETALSLVRTTYSLCGAMNASVELIHMVPVPRQVPLSDARRYMLEGKEAMVETMLYLGPSFPIGTTLRYCRSVARGIVVAARQKRVDLLIMGWQGIPSDRLFNLGSTADPVLESVPCDVLLLKDCGGHKFRRILVPLGGGPNAVLAMRTACMLAAQNDGTVTLFSVITGSGKYGFDPDKFLASQGDSLSINPDRIVTRITHDHRVAHAILEESENKERDYDLVVMGYTREPLLRQVTKHSLPHLVARLCSKPLIMANAATGIRSFLRRWI